MDKKVGRNDPCPCGSGKKYKQCCLLKKAPGGKGKFKATLISGGGMEKQPPDLMMRTFGNAIKKAEDEGKPPSPPKDKSEPKKTS